MRVHFRGVLLAERYGVISLRIRPVLRPGAPAVGLAR
jgi:hypothetical protein